MWEAHRVGKIRDVGQSAIEDIRVIAAIALVTYHVIGTPDSGLRLQYPHVLRFCADLLAGFRMPAFVFIAGFAFCLRPPGLQSFGRFVERKLRRLVLPGLIAALAFAIASGFLGTRFALPEASLWQIAIYPYAHFWFLQAILVLFLTLGVADAALSNKGEFVLLAVTLILVLTLNLFGIAPPEIFSIGRAIQLAPCFAVGMCVYRHACWIERHAALVTLIAGGLVLTSLGSSILQYLGNPSVPPSAGTARAMIFGLPLCLLLLLHLPHQPAAQTVGRFTFTIYLYHVFATASTRGLLHHFGVTSLGLNVMMGTAAGVVLPVLLHRVAILSPVTAALLLGVKTPGKTAKPKPQPDAALPPLQPAMATAATHG